MTSKLHSNKVHRPFYRRYKTTKPHQENSFLMEKTRRDSPVVSWAEQEILSSAQTEQEPAHWSTPHSQIPDITNYFVTQGAFSKHTLYIDITSYPLGKSASGGEDSAAPSCRQLGRAGNPVVSPNRARVTTPVNSHPQTPNGNFCPKCLALTHLELDCKSPSHS